MVDQWDNNNLVMVKLKVEMGSNRIQPLTNNDNRADDHVDTFNVSFDDVHVVHVVMKKVAKPLR